MNKLKSYKELLKSLKKYEDILKVDHKVESFKGHLEEMITRYDWADHLGINIEGECIFGNALGGHLCFDSYGWKQHIRISLFGSQSGRTIACSDDRRQPEEGELLYFITFPTGAYIFGEHYDTELFSMMFDELKAYQPKYSDTLNKALYFSKENAANIHKDFEGIYNKYMNMVGESVKKAKLKKLEDEIERLKSS